MPAPQLYNPGSSGQNARYDTTGLAWDGGAFVDDAGWRYDSNGLSLNRPDSWVDGLPPADQMGGSGGGPSSGGAGLSSPYFQQAQAAAAAASAADAAARRAAVQQALIAFGLIPDNVSNTYGDVDDTTRNLATANTTSGISILARLREALEKSQRDAGRQLAGRGLRRSGERGYLLRQNQLGYDRNYSDALSKLLGGINQTNQGFAQAEAGRQMSLAQALQQALASFVPSYSRPGGSSPPSYSPPSAAPPQPAAPVFSPQASQPNVPFFQVPGGTVAGGVLRAGEDLF